jgi:hypothetical protein
MKSLKEISLGFWVGVCSSWFANAVALPSIFISLIGKILYPHAPLWLMIIYYIISSFYFTYILLLLINRINLTKKYGEWVNEWGKQLSREQSKVIKNPKMEDAHISKGFQSLIADADIAKTTTGLQLALAIAIAVVTSVTIWVILPALTLCVLTLFK